MLVLIWFACTPDIVFQETYDFHGRNIGESIFTHAGEFLTVVSESPGHVTVRRGEQSSVFALPGEGRLTNTRISPDDTRLYVQGSDGAYELDMKENTVIARGYGDAAFGPSGELVRLDRSDWSSSAFVVNGVTGPTFAEQCDRLQQTATGEVIARCDQHLRFVFSEQSVSIPLGAADLVPSPSGARGFFTLLWPRDFHHDESDIYVVNGTSAVKVLTVPDIVTLAPESDHAVIAMGTAGWFRIREGSDGWDFDPLTTGDLGYLTPPAPERLSRTGFVRVVETQPERISDLSCGRQTLEVTYVLRRVTCDNSSCAETDVMTLGTATKTGLYAQDSPSGCAGAGAPLWIAVFLLALIRRRPRHGARSGELVP